MSLLSPCTHLIVDGREIEVFRCETDGGIVIRSKDYDSQSLFRDHSGHKLKQPVILKFGEIEEILDELGIER